MNLSPSSKVVLLAGQQGVLCLPILRNCENLLMERYTKTGSRIHTLDCAGTNDHLEYLLGAFGSGRSSAVSSIRLHVTPYNEHGPKEHTTAFLSQSFPKLSELDIKNFQPGSSSSIFTTSNLISLKLGIPYRGGNQYTRSEFLQILQQHPDLQELHLWEGGMPQVEPLGPSPPLVPIALSRLVDLRLYGTEPTIAESVDLISMSSPLHNVVIDFGPTPIPITSVLTNAVQKILASYYECQGLDYPRMAHHLTVSSDSQKQLLVFNTKPHSTSASRSTSSFELRLGAVNRSLAGNLCLLFPLNHVHTFAAIGLHLYRGMWCDLLGKMEGLFHLWLDDMDIGPAMGALGVGNELKYGSPGLPTPNLQSLTLSNLAIRPDPDQGLLGALYDRCDKIALKSLVVQSCRVHDSRYEEWVRELVEKVTWDDVMVIDLPENDSEAESRDK